MTRRRSAHQATIDEFGIADSYLDAHEQWRTVSRPTRERLRSAMDDDALSLKHAKSNGQPLKDSRALLVPLGQSAPLTKPAELRLEDGTILKADKKLPPDLPPGYHLLRTARHPAGRQLIVHPETCYLPDDLRMWGWAVQLYSLRSRRSWGIGDLADLRRLNRWSKKFEPGITLINPLGADTPGFPTNASPYAPSSRCFRNVLFLSVEKVPGFNRNAPEMKSAIAAAKSLNKTSIIDRDASLKLKLGALERCWSSFQGDAALDAFVREQGSLLATFCRFCVLAEKFGRDWRKWPAKYRHPDSPAVPKFAEEHAARIRFYAWIQWLVDCQLATASREVPLMQDFPIGVDPAGADAWIWQEFFANEVSAGAPPDLYNQAGQNWGLQVFVPHKLQAGGFVPFIQTVRALLRYAGGLRIDHVMGLYRLFWIPDGMTPERGGYVHYPTDELLAILAIESHRAKAFIVGEDLGTVDRDMRQTFMDHKLLSYRLMWFENDPPQRFPRASLASVSTHDLPTIAGLWTGQDERDEAKAGVNSNSTGWQAMRKRLAKLTKSGRGTSLDEVIRCTYKSLAKASSAVVTASLEDALAVLHRPNMPSTVDTWPNWSQPLPGGLEQVETSKLARAIAMTLQAHQSRRRRKSVARRPSAGGSNSRGLRAQAKPKTR